MLCAKLIVQEHNKTNHLQVGVAYIQWLSIAKGPSVKIELSSRVRDKLRDKHRVTEKELRECFENRAGRDLFDSRAEHQTDPLTRWFLAYTNRQRLLKIVFIPNVLGKGVRVKTAYEPNHGEIEIYKKHGWQ